MKVICDRAALREIVNLISGVVATRTPKPQLTGVRITASKKGGTGVLAFAGTDAEVSLRTATTHVEVQKEGEVLIPADKLRQIVSAEDQEPTLTLTSDADDLTIRGQDARFVIRGFPAAEFPAMPDFPDDSDSAFSMKPTQIGSLIARTIFSTARENSRYAINGVLLNRKGKKIEMVATDGRRLAMARGSVESGGGGGGDGEATCIVPTKALNLLLKLIDTAGADVDIAITENQSFFRLKGDEEGSETLLVSNLVEGTFPPYEDVIPKDQDKKATFAVEVLSSAVRRAALLTNEESRGVRMAFNPKGEKALTLSSRAPEMGEAEINVSMEKYEGDQIEIGFNPAFITDALKVLDGEEVILEMKAPNKPGLIRSGQNFVYVVMPVNLQ